MTNGGLFNSAIEILQSMGFFSIVLPFLLIYSIVYGILVRTKIFGEGAANVNAMVAFVLALLFVAAANVVDVMEAFVPWVGLIAVFIVCFMMISVLVLGGDISEFAKDYRKPVIILVFITMVFALISTAGWLDMLVDFVIGFFSIEEVLGLVVVGIVLALVFAITRSAKGEVKE